MTIPIALTIAGSDSSGGAGIQADLKSFAAQRVYGASVITALTAQNTQGVTAIHAVPPAIIRAQMDAVFDDLAVKAIKIGMLGNRETISAVADGLMARECPFIVLDPVMVAQSGAALIDDGAVDALIANLFPRALLVTPNLPEAARLAGGVMARDEGEMAAQGRIILARGARAVLVKGGHGSGDMAIDILVSETGVTRFSAPRLAVRNTHGTGCSLSSAIAALLARGLTLEEAVGQAKTWLSGAIARAGELEVGQGAGPVHHFHELWGG
ncbi:bifunctional hydroxymethylpyrimidine kinase/phosphomethylpyrimidine kinase [Candidatus Raskinella chloraquaticus]|uniref:hydroxymethylpyrimidine kinase n=1 Tax=Candidatus Raskinella chloraquaticus TaxID=1951219 RepID=A0A1W9HRM9_9HYPH|nr:MAG: hydroxymethylpyrimidine/phosphomethylpyrimidine kinase [Proteobacteria bacterium SG_bin8]